MRYFKVTTVTTMKNEEIEMNEYVKVPNPKVNQFLIETLELDQYDQSISLKECEVGKGKWECPVGDFIITEHYDEKAFQKLTDRRTRKPLSS